MKRISIFLILLLVFSIGFSDSLWKKTKVNNLLSNPEKNYSVGDIITVAVSENPSLSLSDDNPDPFSGVMGTVGAIFNTIGNIDLMKFFPLGANKPEDVKVTNKKASSQSKASVNLYVSAEVVEILDNGIVKIHGEKEFKVDSQKKIMIIEGYADPSNIKDGVIDSKNLANAKIWYQGDTDLQKDPNNKTWLAWLLSGISNLFF
ncbi:flagellar L-ring protein precursor FlgH [Marinitoga hydrogenitolerans DSM 16785]|uniref:Flagellar L-ring protein FlgH n=1 Tax=Marinitoga hydrogenitolerans (strain DSM 16785 / JCM 12826 / AT1271) TaxID=1122195 RepID=A0A1M4ZCC9_MARH1|nr:flagellar basal body L-ring protein FlgH [Marinitoga hydrogenitolerans]SHF15442.1 flagellar L-ring protein precursor FlgH [Marinitoga hydrogenitolerans DSM 16785]